MTDARPSFAVVTPARNEAANLMRLADSMIAQTMLPAPWVIVDHGSTDDTSGIAGELAVQHRWIRVVTIGGEAVPTRGGPIVHAFTAGLAEVGELPDVVVKLDADVSFEPDHFERLLAEFVRDPALGIASSTCWEEKDGSWQEQRVARSHVRGAVRAYRRECLRDVIPLEQRFGWDTIDELKAQLNGWRTRSLDGVAFYHHRETGARDGTRRSWESQGDLAWYLGYRLSYLLLRTAFRARHDVAALATLYGWARAGLRGEPRYPDPEIRRLLRDQQSLSQLPRRAREVLSRRDAP
jgi:glycosyltransferase involved in cell wall biosynthesis